MLAIIQGIGVIQSVIIAACLGFMLGMLAVIVGGRRKNISCTDDYLDWSKIPEGRDWVAIDGEQVWSGSLVRCYTMEPRISSVGEYYIDDSAEEDIPVPDNAIIGPLPPWRESLRRRPS